MDKQDELVRRTRGEPGRTRRIWQADRQCVIWLYHSPCFLRGIHYDAAPALAPSTAQTAVGLYWYWQGWPKARREGADGWCPSTPTGITQRRVGYRGQERICVSALSKCHVSRESMFKEGEKEWFIFYAINTHAYFRFYVAFLITSSKQIGRHFWLSVNMTINILLKPKKKVPSWFILGYISTKNLLPTSDQAGNFALEGQSFKSKPAMVWFCYIFIDLLYIYSDQRLLWPLCSQVARIKY